MQTDNTIPPFSFIRPNPVKGHGGFNGYISLPIGHPWYGKTYPKLQEVDIDYELNYSEEEDGRWVIGFDTAHASDERLKLWSSDSYNSCLESLGRREGVREEANRLLEHAEITEWFELEQEQERRVNLECREKREEGRHWYQPYPEAVPLDLWELFRAITYEIHGKITHDLLMETVSHHSTRSDKLDAYRIYPTRGDGILTAGSSFKLIVGIRYGMGVGDYDSPFVTNETAALFNLDPSKKTMKTSNHWHQPYSGAVPLDLWEVMRAKTAEYNKDNPHYERTVIDTAEYLSQATAKLDAYRFYSDEKCRWLTVGVRYGNAAHEYICFELSPEVVGQFNLDPLNLDQE